ncbi:hypothetical protein FRC07_011427 [Ceratobasidium sp. 392]|nr:hypothetical protein FRC07_011427 [Ceratobasidium sp. 392]
MSTTARKVFNTPELLDLICSHCTKSSCAGILCASKVGFPTAASFLWSDVDDMMNLFALFPSAVTSPSTNLNPTVDFQPVKLDFSRFKLYVPYIKSLKIYHKQHMSLSNWHIINSVLGQRPLLPNLRSLSIHYLDDSPPVRLYVDWLNWLVSPLLTKVEFVGPVAKGLSPLEVLTVLHIVVNRCPRLERLALPQHDPQLVGVFEETSIQLGQLQIRTPEKYLSELRSLRELEVSSSFLALEPFRMISELPQLQSLKLYWVGEELIPSSVEFASNSFSRLQKLVLIRFLEPEVEAILDLIPVLSRLTLLELALRHHIEDYWVETALLPRLEKMIHLSTLRFSFNCMEITDDLGFGSPSAARILSHLPLKEVELDCVWFDELADLASMLPHVKQLEVPDSEMTLHLPTPFALLPQLEDLVVTLNLDEDLAFHHYPIPGSLAFRTLRLFHLSKIPFNVKLLLQASQTLLDIWPNIHQIVPASPNWKPQIDRIVASFNTCLSVARDARDLRARMAEKYGEKEAGSMLPGKF